MSNYQTSFDSQLIEDYLHTTEIFVALPNKGPKACVAPYINHKGQSEALVISKDDSGENSIYQVVREPLSDSGWNYYGLGAQPSLMAVVDETHAWIYGTDNWFWIYKNGTWKRQDKKPDFDVIKDRAMLDPNASGAFVPRMSASTDGIIWCLDHDGVVYECDHTRDNPDWHNSQVLEYMNCLQAPVGSSTNFYVLDESQQILHFNETDAKNGQRIQVNDMLVSMIALGVDGQLWALLYQPNTLPNSATLFQYQADSASWKSYGDTPLDFITVGDDKHLFGLTSLDKNPNPENHEANLAIQQFNLDTNTWTQIQSKAVVGVYVDGKMVMENAFGLVAVPGQNKFWYFDTLIKTWSGTWSTVMMPTGLRGPLLTENQGNFTGNVTEVVVGLDQRVPDVTRSFFIAGNRIFYSTYLEGQAWSFPTIIQDGPYHNLGLTNQMDDGSLILYAAESEQGSLLTALQEKPTLASQWTIQEADTNGMLKPSTTPGYPLALALTAKNANDWCFYTNYGANLMVAFGNAKDPVGNNNFVKYLGDQGDIRAKGIVRIPVGQQEIDHYVAVIDETQNMQLVWNIVDESGKAGGKSTPIAGPGTSLSNIQVYSGVLDANNMIRIYATDENEKLWVLRQTDTTPQDNLPFGLTHWHPLGDSCTFLANGPGMYATTEVFLLDNDHFLQSVKQNPISGIWESIPIHKPQLAGEEPLYVSQYVTEFQVNQANGPIPKPGLAVTVSSGEAMAIWHKGKQYNISAQNPATLYTDGYGRVSVNSLAFGIHTPGLTFNASGFAAPVTVYPAQAVHNQLNNLSAGNLQKAQKKTSLNTTTPLVNGANPNLDAAAQAINATYQIKEKNKIGPANYTGAGIAPGPGHQAALRQAWQSKVKSVKVLPSPKAAASGNFLTDFWHSLVHFGEDVWHAIKKGIMAIKHALVDVEQGLIHLTVELANIGQAVVQFVIKTVDDIGHAVQTAFHWIEVGVEDALNWLKKVFDWGDILATKTVLEYYLNQTLQNITSSVDPNSTNNVQHLINTKFDELVHLIKGDDNTPGVFAKLKTQVGTQSFNAYTQGLPNNPKVSGGKSTLYPQNIQQTHQNNQVKSNYVHNKLNNFHSRGGSFSSAVSAGSTHQIHNLSDLFTDLIKSFEDTFQLAFSKSTFHQQQQAALGKIQSLFQSSTTSGIEGFFDVAIADVLVILEDIAIFVIGILKDILVEVMNAVGLCLETLVKILNQPIEIPVLSWLYQKISNHPLTILDVASLVFALPATVLYKILHGGDQAPPPFATQPNALGIPQVSKIINTPIPWPNEYLSQTPNTRSLATNEVTEEESGKEEKEEENNSLTTIMGFVVLFNSIVKVGADMASDVDEIVERNTGEAEADPAEAGNEKASIDSSVIYSFLLLFSEVVEMGIGNPSKQINKAYADRSLADHFCIAVWASTSVSIALDVIAIVGGLKKGKAMKFQEAGPWIESIAGLLQLGLGVAAAVEYTQDPNKEYSAAASVEGILGPIPSFFKFLDTTEGDPIEVAVATVVMMGLDFLCDMGSAVCGFLEEAEIV